ncbi:hypothetical protein [Ciceribacter sp. RN22]|uniref:AbiTii domain-containing protein n=1 Tax=Ciceribacter sp. RN22 TaxID=2954932 RepID=UPI0020939900|nr:hypothetical protein [Ciceribacter sp. RN22]MCO6178962.1 hypothetical protein [Ciceribacter sp. RN22]
MGLLAEIQNDALSDTVPVATLLRKVMVLAANLDSALLEDWVRHELHGYDADVEVPAYRKFVMNFKVSGANARWQLTGQPVPQVLVNQIVNDDTFHFFECRQPIGTISPDEIKASKGKLSINLDNYVLLMQGKLFEPSFNISRFWGEVSASQVMGIIDAVRSRVLDFVLKLKRTYPDAGEIDGLTTKTPEVNQAVTQIYNTTIHGDNAGPVGNNSGATINVTVNAGSIKDLRSVLAKEGVEEADLIELEAAVSSEPAIGQDKKFGPKVTVWLGKMVSKAGSGAWAVSLGAAGALLEKALLGYYGYN